jgi:hypothetical protein
LLQIPGKNIPAASCHKLLPDGARRRVLSYSAGLMRPASSSFPSLALTTMISPDST